MLSLAGSEDGLSTPAKIADARGNLPEDAFMVEIDGASHASFGDYGAQDGDGTPLISDAAMDLAVTESVAEFVGTEGVGSR
ncbi:MAG: alpha/beta hydrolase [Brachybacterium sp.]|uniref:alpha/beta hydrolase n=1 Tax=Brachybacterium sp. TaxID=1891286 RepID=UPI0026495641|nr:alpha/beta hydrolase [Brachybacterium sp.]MDN5687412.1 alpha/beta hydrolase [Brachybacterium sp.]